MNPLFQILAKKMIKTATRNWKAFSHLILYGDDAGWVLDWEMRELRRICSKIGVRVIKPMWKHASAPQSLFFFNHFFLQNDNWLNLLPHRIGFAYLHGLPNKGFEGFDNVYRAVERHHEKISRIQVTHTEMRDSVLNTGIDPLKVFMIPIGINLEFFPFQTLEMKQKARLEFGIPQTAFVIGSIQKDGVGWGDGMEPKLEKGPDILVETARMLKKDIPEMVVLLVGPARGYVKAGLEKANIRYIHVPQQSYPKVGRLFSALDLYLITSRQEGGPKAVLESMGSGVPLVTTRMGHAMDVVQHGENAWMAEVGDFEMLASHVLHVYRSSNDALIPVLKSARATAEANSYESQIPLWAEFMKGFVE
jgi:glycosyltransferase involved in cell wall biosynthesis